MQADSRELRERHQLYNVHRTLTEHKGTAEAYIYVVIDQDKATSLLCHNLSRTLRTSTDVVLHPWFDSVIELNILGVEICGSLTSRVLSTVISSEPQTFSER